MLLFILALCCQLDQSRAIMINSYIYYLADKVVSIDMFYFKHDLGLEQVLHVEGKVFGLSN